ncbi:MAG: discoidin domain-containing protein [Magnetococcales bacterium]|nr:discoidin domain-containing protein [Magnetococcales bacterium]
MADHRYWRVNITLANNINGYLAIAEMEMRGASGGENLCTDPAKISSSAYTAQKDKLIDSDISGGNYWSTDGDLPSWFSYDFTTEITIREVAFLCNFSTSNTPKDLHLQHSDDGLTWTTVFSWIDRDAWVLNTWVAFTVPGPFTGTLCGRSS